MLILVAFGAAAYLGTSSGTVNAQAAAPAIQTNKTGYLAGETVSISGSGFAANDVVALRITHGGVAEADTTLQANEAGAFAYTWTMTSPDAPANNSFVASATAASGGSAQTAFKRIAVVQTDKYDYLPGSTAIITGAGFRPAENVMVHVEHSNGVVNGVSNLPYAVSADYNGRINTTWHVENSNGSIFRLTATGVDSGLTATSTFTDPAVMVVDDGGADDKPGQKDLNDWQVDYAPSSGDIGVVWDWDDTDWSGNNTGDACTLFDTSADGFADYSLCVTVQGSPATFVAERLYTCSNKNSDRCSQPTLVITPLLSTASASVVANTDPFGVLASPYYNPAHVSGSNTCSDTPGCYTDDTVANVTIDLSDFGTQSAKLINICSYPSQEPNSDPEECVVTPNSGFLTIVKTTQNVQTLYPDTFTFTASAGSQNGTTTWMKTFNADGTQTVVSQISYAPTTTLDLTETATKNGWQLDSVSCKIQNGSLDSTGTLTATGIDNLEIRSGLETICTFTNSEKKEKPTFTTTVHNATHGAQTTFDLGSTVHDYASASGNQGTVEGTVTFKFFLNGTCAGDPAHTSSALSLSSGSVDATGFAQGPLGAGDYSFIAHYTPASGSNYLAADSDCEPLTVNRGSAGQYLITTEIHNASEAVVTSGVPLGTTVHDKAILSGGTTATIVPTGTVTFTFYTTTSDCTGTSTGAGTITLDGTAVAHPSGSEGPLAAGSYSFRAHYDGDTNYAGGDGPCESLTVNKKTLTLYTTMHRTDAAHTLVTNGSHVPLGTALHDNASLSGAVAGFTPTGAITFTFSGGALGANASTEAGFYATSASTGALGAQAGAYSFSAAYAGDSNYNAIIAGTHNPETFFVDKKQLYISTIVHDSSHNVIPDNGAVIGTVHDTAVVTGQVTGFSPTGAITFTLDKALPCGTTAIATAAGTDSASGNPRSVDSATLTDAGTYNFRAVVAGDSNYLGATSLCEPFKVSTITVIKNAKPAQGNFGFTTTGTGYNGFTLTGATAGNGNKNTQTLLPNTTSNPNYTVKEGTQLGWILDGIGGSTDPNTPYNCTVVGTGGSSGVGDLTTQIATITLKAGDAVTCVFENTGNGATRTQGFWATHPQLANIAWFGGSAFNHTFPGVAAVAGIGDKTLCSSLLLYNGTTVGKNIDALSKVMGGFWSDISKTSGGTKRANIDQSRMQLLQQLLAAELNASAFGSVPSGGSGMFAQWESAYCNTTGGAGQAIQTALQQAASFNSQGDSSTFTPGTSADSKNARAIADTAFWNSLP